MLDEARYGGRWYRTPDDRLVRGASEERMHGLVMSGLCLRGHYVHTQCDDVVLCAITVGGGVRQAAGAMLVRVAADADVARSAHLPFPV